MTIPNFGYYVTKIYENILYGFDEEIFSCQDALHFSYRILLGRAPDHIGHALYSSFRYPIALKDIVYPIVRSHEFTSIWLSHINRIRADHAHPLVWHIHLPRTGGTRFAESWRGNGGHVFAAPLRPGVEPKIDDVLSLLLQLVELRQAIEGKVPVLISGHITLSEIASHIRPQDTIVATCRHPVDRMLSLYRYAKSMANGGFDIINYPNMDQRDFFSTNWRETLRSHDLKHGEMTFHEFSGSALCTDGNFDHFLALGPSDNLGRFMVDSRIQIVNQEAIAEPTRINATPHPIHSEEDRLLLRHLLTRDLIRYEEIVDAFRYLPEPLLIDLMVNT